MKKKRFSVEQIVGVLKQAEVPRPAGRDQSRDGRIVAGDECHARCEVESVVACISGETSHYSD